MLIRLIDNEQPGARTRIIAAAAISGVANASTVAIVNTVAGDRAHAGMSSFVLYIFVLLAYIFGLRYSVGHASRNIESALCRVRVELANSIRRAELQGLETIGTAEIYERMTDQATILSTAAWPLALGLQGTVMLVCTIGYMAFVAPELLLLTLAFFGLGVLFHQSRQSQMKRTMQEAAKLRARLFDRLGDIIYGFKEVRLNTPRSDAVHADFQKVANGLLETSVASNLITQENFVFAQILQFSVMGSAVFILPQFIKVDSHTLMSSVSALLLILAPLGQVLYIIPVYERANMAAQNITKMQERLNEFSSRDNGKASSNGKKSTFSKLELEGLEFRRVDPGGRETFKVGPIDLTIKAGEIVFIVGGNGSGKTTLLRAMTALYAPTAGRLSVNGDEIDVYNRQSYREMITAIFGDFHLFRHLYGISGFSATDVQRLLEQLDLAQKTQLVNGEWKNIDLSTGQRKRLAMVGALLEDRPIYVFDEWAADQDPEFRQYFYEVLLQDLKKRGKTVIAISHDDRYFCWADTIVTLEYGKLRSVTQGQRNAGESGAQVEVGGL
jgi:putative pyoverdin transport system ATP-binding/permease protein